MLGRPFEKPKQQGFTLIELLVAMVITASIGAMAFASVSTARRSIEVMQVRADRLSELNGFFLRFSKDVEHIVPRGALIDGENKHALEYKSIDSDGLSFTSNVWVNPFPDLYARSSLERISYILEDNKLIRKRWNKINSQSDEDVKEYTILNNVDKIQVRFVAPIKINNITGRVPSLRWVREWPNRGSASQNVPADVNPFDLLPMAMEFKIELEPWGELVRVFEVGYD